MSSRRGLPVRTSTSVALAWATSLRALLSPELLLGAGLADKIAELDGCAEVMDGECPIGLARLGLDAPKEWLTWRARMLQRSTEGRTDAVLRPLHLRAVCIVLPTVPEREEGVHSIDTYACIPYGMINV